MAITARPLFTPRQRDALRSLTEIAVAAIELIGSGGLITIDDIVPGVRRFLRGDGRDWDLSRIPRAIQRAERRRFISVSAERKGSKRIQLTERGRALLARRLLEGCAADRPRRWDGRWRILAFDVPERKRRERDALRKMLRRLGFVPLQRSVWVYPFDCVEVIALLRAANQLSHIIVRSITALEIEDDRSLRRRFSLRRLNQQIS